MQELLLQIENIIYALYFYLLNFLANRRGIWILMYHRINDKLSPGYFIISPKKFGEQMRYLKKYCDVVSIQSVYDIYINRKEIKRSRKPQVVITIDDGYRDSYQNAYPLLKKLKLPTTIFLATGFIGTNKKMQRYEEMPSPDMLNWEEVRTMNTGGITFCPHTDSHPYLEELSHVEQMKEIKNSMEAIATNLSTEGDNFTFSYTYGKYNQVTLNILRELGVKLAVTCKEGINSLKDEPLELRRHCVDGRDTLVDFMRKLSPDFQTAMRWRFEMLIKGKRW